MILKEYNPEIYPFILYVSINLSKEDASKEFNGYTYEDELVDFEDIDMNKISAIASTYIVVHKATGNRGYLIDLIDLNLCDTAIIAHEASHVAIAACERLGITFDTFKDSEALAYLIEWISKCTEKTKNEYNSKQKQGSK